MTGFQELSDFVDRAEKSRKYPASTAYALKAAIKLYGADLTDDERASIDLFKKNFEQVTQSVFTKNRKTSTASSLATYKSRMQKVLADYERYSDPIKMNSWSPKVVMRTKKPSAGGKQNTERSNEDDEDVDIDTASTVAMHRIELAIRDGVKALIKVPHDLSEAEAKRLKALLDSLTQG